MAQGKIDFDTIRQMFSNGSRYDASPKILQSCLHCLATEGITNDRVRHVAIVQALTINHIQTAQVIRHLNEQNQKAQWLLKVVAIGALIIGFLGLFL